MAITISGVNNNDKILASDGVIDQLSGFSVVGVMTAASFSGNLIGDVTGNLTGNVNASSNLLLQIGGSEKFRVASSGQLGIGGANYGSSGQVLTSGGSGSAASWTTITQGFSPDAQNNLVAGTNAGDSFSGTDANHNLLLGFDAGTNITSGDDNICLGRDAGKATTVYSDNVYIGPECGKQNNAANNVCIGNFAGGKLTGAADNVYIGYQTGEGLFSGTRTGSKNVALGKYALAEITTGHRNVVLGDTAANKLQNGSDNVIIGTQAATTGTNDLVNGSNNIILGHDAVASSSSVSNEITLGDTAITKFRIPGINFILKDNGGTPTQGHVLTVDANGEASFAASSGTTINSNADNRIITGSGTANTLEAESNLTFNSSSLNVGAGVTIETNGQATYAGIVTASSFKLSDGSSVGGAVSSDSEFNVVVGTNAGGGLVSGGEKNVMVGHNAGLGMTTSDRSVVIGYEAAKNTYRGGLVAIGYQALMYGTNPTGSKGDSHTAIGNECMRNLGYYVNYNTAVGSNAMKNATSGFNSAFGVGALQSGSGEINTAIGMNSLDVCNGSWNSALGYKSGDDCTSGSKNSLIGVYAGEDIGSGSHNLCLGAYSTVSASGVSNECVIGAPSGHASVINHVRMPGIGVSFSAGGGVVTGIMTASSFKFLDGSTVGGVTSDAQGNTVGGSGAGDSFTGTDAENNTLFGKDAGTAITSADSTTAVGKDAGKSITTGSYNHLFGIGAGDAITTGTNNTIMGHHAGSSFSTASSNTIVGGNAGGGSSLGSNNVIIGKSCNQNNEGQRNVFIGQGAVAYRSGTATDNVIIGQAAAEFLTNGNHNAGVGKDVFDDISTGSDNSALGSNAGDTLTTGSNNLFLGHDAFPSSATVSNEITLGDTNITKFRIPGLSYTIDDGGRVLVNGTGSSSPDGFNSLLQVNSGNHEGSITIGRHTANSNGPALLFQKSRSGSATPGDGVLSNNDTLGVIRFYGSDGTDRNSFAANIGCEVDGTPGGNDMPGRLIFSTTSDGAASSTERLRIKSNGRLLYGNQINDRGAELQYEGDQHACLGLHRNANSHGAPALHFSASRGTSAGSNTIVQNGDYLGMISFKGTDGSDLASGAYITSQVDGTPGSNDMPARLGFWTSPDGSQSPEERLRIHSTGQVSISHSNYLGNSHDYKLVVKPNINDSTKPSLGLLIDGDSGTGGGVSADSIGIKIVNTNTWNNATHQYGLWNEVGQQYISAGTGIFSKITGLYGNTTGVLVELNKNLGAYTSGFAYYANIKPTNSGGNTYFFYGVKDDSNLKVRILQNGNLQNANNSYGSTSDVKLKENIVDAGSQWDDIKALRIRNFNFKDDPDKEKMLGVVAQEAETVSPGLIETENDTVVDDTTGIGTVTGTTKFVKYSILYMKAVKALQEAQARIEILESKVSALEGS